LGGVLDLSANALHFNALRRHPAPYPLHVCAVAFEFGKWLASAVASARLFCEVFPGRRPG